MDHKPLTDLTEAELQQLETRVESLLRAVSELRNENDLLRSRQERLVIERAELLEKSELARNRVEAMITRLKSMESNL
ncbi:MAG TPA: TIGR02449 family protein [Sedimenticola sp.]|nr:TIGR02449 family protein [Sedimenticola sp.]